MPVCYNFDTTDNILGYDKGAGGRVDSQSTPNTTAEGNQNEGKYLRVEDPAVDNLDWFAGVIAGTSEDGKVGPRWVDIFVCNGAIVPVRTVLTATSVGRTILSVNSGTLTFGNPTDDVRDYLSTSNDDTAGTIDARPVAVAMETISSAGLVLAKLCPDLFVHQGGQVDYEMEVAAGTVNCTVNRSFVEFNNTAGHCQMLHYRARLAGAGGDGHRGVYRFETILEGIPVAHQDIYGIMSHLELAADITTAAGGAHCSPLKLTLRTQNVDPDLRGVSILSMIHLDWILRASTTGTLTNPPSGNYFSTIIYINADTAGTLPDYFLRAESPACIGAYASTTNAPVLATGDIMIPWKLGGSTYYVVALADNGI
jgi:hypothetical protein